MAWQFDQAVMVFGLHIESKLNERDKRTNKPRHTLQNLLGEKPVRPQVVSMATLRGMGVEIVTQ